MRPAFCLSKVPSLSVQVFCRHIIFFMFTKKLYSEISKLFSLYVIFFFVSFFVSYFLSLFLSSPCFPFLILVYCTFFPSSVITHERGNYASCHFLVCWLVPLYIPLSFSTVGQLLCQFCPGPEYRLSNLVLTCSVLVATFLPYPHHSNLFFFLLGQLSIMLSGWFCIWSLNTDLSLFLNFDVKFFTSFSFTTSKLMMIL